MGSQRMSIDRELGARVRIARLHSDLPQSTLATILGVSLEQVARLEAGEEPISSEQLTEIATALRHTISFFFQGWIESIPQSRDPAWTPPLAAAHPSLLVDRDPDWASSATARPYLQ